MPAANLLTDDGHLTVSTDAGSGATQKVGAQSFSTMAGGNIAGADNCNVHVALFALLGVAFIILLRKGGIHALSLEG
jgi:hypothetical protein